MNFPKRRPKQEIKLLFWLWSSSTYWITPFLSSKKLVFVLVTMSSFQLIAMHHFCLPNPNPKKEQTAYIDKKPNPNACVSDWSPTFRYVKNYYVNGPDRSECVTWKLGQSRRTRHPRANTQQTRSFYTHRGKTRETIKEGIAV